MGVHGYRTLLIKKHKKCIVELKDYYDYVFIDGNCTLHDTFINGIDYELQFENIYNKFINLFNKFKSLHYYIVFDGQAPLNKQITQRERRENNFDDSSLFLPGIFIIDELEIFLMEKFDSNVTLISSSELGEGEQKIFIKLKQLDLNNTNNILLISLDTDVIILAQLLLLNKEINIDVYIHTIVEQESNKKDIIFNVNLLNINMFKGNLNENNLLLLAFLCGNDFIIKNTTFEKFKTASDLYKNFIDNNIINISQLSFSKCAHKCIRKITEKNIKIYSNLFNWYKLYFLKNEFISCKSYLFKETPCCFCLNFYVNEPLKLISPPEDYHKGILTKPVLDSLYLKTEIKRLSKIEF